MRDLVIEGLKIYTEEQLLAKTGLQKRMPNAVYAKKIRTKIRKFYESEGYTIVSVYQMENTPELCKIYVDEGKIGKVVFLDVGDFELVGVKIRFRLPHGIFSEKAMAENVIKFNKMGYKQVTYRLQKIMDYTNAPIQLDRKFFGSLKLPFFDDYGPSYDLYISLSKSSPQTQSEVAAEQERSRNGFDYRVRVSLNSGLLPEVAYYHHDMIAKGDFFKIGSSFGVMYGFNGVFDKPPSLTFVQSGFGYDFKPLWNNHFTPSMSASFIWTHNGRSDIGLLEYEFVRSDFVIAPGTTIKNRLKAYFIAGEEITSFIDTRTDRNETNRSRYPGKEYPVHVQGITDYFTMLGIALNFEMIPVRIGNPLNKNISLSYLVYVPERDAAKRYFHEFKLGALYDIEMRNRSIYSIVGQYTFLWKDPPFYHQAPVNSAAFKGLGGYYSKNCAALSNEYRFSVYRDHIYLGVFFDMTLFEGLGYNVSGPQFAFLGGPTLRFLILDQLEVYLHYGVGYFVTESSFLNGYSFGLHRRW